MKKILLVAVLLTNYAFFYSEYSYAFSTQESNSQISGQGVVTRLLADDNKGSRHQKFIIMLPSGQTLLIVHNIDLAPRINSLRVGDSIQFYGEYEWNERGGGCSLDTSRSEWHTSSWLVATRRQAISVTPSTLLPCLFVYRRLHVTEYDLVRSSGY